MPVFGRGVYGRGQLRMLEMLRLAGYGAGRMTWVSC